MMNMFNSLKVIYLEESPMNFRHLSQNTLLKSMGLNRNEMHLGPDVQR